MRKHVDSCSMKAPTSRPQHVATSGFPKAATTSTPNKRGKMKSFDISSISMIESPTKSKPFQSKDPVKKVNNSVVCYKKSQDIENSLTKSIAQKGKISAKHSFITMLVLCFVFRAHDLNEINFKAEFSS